jgi:hypothetical protein
MANPEDRRHGWPFLVIVFVIAMGLAYLFSTKITENEATAQRLVAKAPLTPEELHELGQARAGITLGYFFTYACLGLGIAWIFVFFAFVNGKHHFSEEQRLEMRRDRELAGVRNAFMSDEERKHNDLKTIALINLMENMDKRNRS